MPRAAAGLAGARAGVMTAAKKFTVVAYCDGEQGCFAHWEHVEAPDRGAAWEEFLRKAALSLPGSVSEQGVPIYRRDLDGLTEVITFYGHVQPV